MSNNLFDYGASLTSNDRHDHPFEASDFQGMLTGEWSPGDSSTEEYSSDGPSLNDYSPGGAATGAYSSGGPSTGAYPSGEPSPSEYSSGGASTGAYSSGGPFLSGYSPGGPSTGAYLSDEPSPSGYSPGMASTGAYLGFASSGPMGHPGVSSGGPCLSGWSPGGLSTGAWSPGAPSAENLDGESWIATAGSQDLTASGLSHSQDLALQALPPTMLSPGYIPTMSPQFQLVPGFAHVDQTPDVQSPLIPAQNGSSHAPASILPTAQHQCRHCARSFGTAKDMRRHLRTVCEADKRYRCCCGYATARKDNYERHLQSPAEKCRIENAVFACVCGMVQLRSEHVAHVRTCGPRRGRPGQSR
ncbi:hypothetical protein PG996_000249 [Apiospora saccharicola]|uniref:C2H2-type domain-containing protein n=1 Tax=Apiospora saccharicola TaxID=335842 RepID=A0ABR1WHA8_9PEZI